MDPTSSDHPWILLMEKKSMRWKQFWTIEEEWDATPS